MKNKQLLILFIVSVVSVLLVLPYLMDAQKDLIDFNDLPFSKGVFVLVATLQAGILIGIALISGRWFAERLSYRLFPSIERKYLIESIIIGISTGLLLLLCDYFYHSSGLTPTFFSLERPIIWKSLLACFYGGIVEEVLMRLLLVSLFAYLISLIFKRSETWRKTSGLISVFLVAIIFGISHLPVMAMMSELSWLMISRVIILNALGGLVFGYLYLRRGLVYAMTAHFLADLVLQVLFPLFYY